MGFFVCKVEKADEEIIKKEAEAYQNYGSQLHKDQETVLQVLLAMAEHIPDKKKRFRKGTSGRIHGLRAFIAEFVKDLSEWTRDDWVMHE